MQNGRNVDAQAREYSGEAIEVLHELMTDPFQEARDRIRAAESLLERGHGKAVSAVISVPLERRQKAEMAAMTDEELMAAIRDTPLPRLAAPRPETFNCGAVWCEGAHTHELELCPDEDPLLK
jgi:hypothetical protein